MSTGLPPAPVPGLCADCRHVKVVETARSTFHLCERSRSDPRFPKYPPLPVRRCAGHEPRIPEPDRGA